VVNTTPLGMYPHPEATPWPESSPFPAEAVVYDLVYNPSETRLVRAARQAGRPADTGAGMLVAQAALAFAFWTGQQPPFDIMEQAFSL
jgi:shikimate dehydrogenase